MDLRDAYNGRNPMVSFDGFKRVVKENRIGYRVMLFKNKMHIVMLDKIVPMKIIKELVKIEEDLSLYYSRVDVYISNSSINIYVG